MLDAIIRFTIIATPSSSEILAQPGVQRVDRLLLFRVDLLETTQREMITSQKERMLIVIHGKQQLNFVSVGDKFGSTPRAKVSSSRVTEIVSKSVGPGNNCMRIVTGLKERYHASGAD